MKPFHLGRSGLPRTIAAGGSARSTTGRLFLCTTLLLAMSLEGFAQREMEQVTVIGPVRSINSCGITVIVFEQSAEPFPTLRRKRKAVYIDFTVALPF